MHFLVKSKMYDYYTFEAVLGVFDTLEKAKSFLIKNHLFEKNLVRHIPQNRFYSKSGHSRIDDTWERTYTFDKTFEIERWSDEKVIATLYFNNDYYIRKFLSEETDDKKRKISELQDLEEFELANRVFDTKRQAFPECENPIDWMKKYGVYYKELLLLDPEIKLLLDFPIDDN
jgi:hypothetical protein